MMLKLAMAFVDVSGRSVLRASITTWHKKEGDWIDYGDDLFDLQVEEIGVPEVLTRLKMEISRLYRSAEGVANLASRQLNGEQVGRAASQESFVTRPRKWAFAMRITASDSGLLRKICAQEGEARQAGDLLALVTTEPDDPIDEAEQASEHALQFRVTENFFSYR